MPERVTVDRKEFEAFLSDNHALLERSQKLIERIDALEKTNKQLRDDLKTANEKLESLEAAMNTSKSQSDESLRKARETMVRLIRESEKWVK
jgi:predicted  nucleic acid-binding Zn-ribbon protein